MKLPSLFSEKPVILHRLPFQEIFEESWGVLEAFWRASFKEGLGRRVAVLFTSSEGWAACSSGCISSVPACGSQVVCDELE